MNSEYINYSDSITEASIASTPAKMLNLDTKSALKFITWNIDGMHEENLVSRTEAVCSIILKEQADIVFLQEVVPVSVKCFQKLLPDYLFVFGNEEGYFISTFLKKSTVSYKGSKIIELPSRMGRNCLKVNVAFKGKNLVLFNSHLESTGKEGVTRILQLRQIFKDVLSFPDDTTAIFAGDLNSRDRELKELGGLPPGIDDVWMSCSSQEECEYTFDMTRNDNLVMDKGRQPRCRFDRIYVRHSSPPQLKLTYFGLIGLERLHTERCFPSDHWGILSHFEVE